jgi:hypothetical protein
MSITKIDIAWLLTPCIRGIAFDFLRQGCGRHQSGGQGGQDQAFHVRSLFSKPINWNNASSIAISLRAESRVILIYRRKKNTIPQPVIYFFYELLKYPRWGSLGQKLSLK